MRTDRDREPNVSFSISQILQTVAIGVYPVSQLGNSRLMPDVRGNNITHAFVGHLVQPTPLRTAIFIYDMWLTRGFETRPRI